MNQKQSCLALLPLGAQMIFDEPITEVVQYCCGTCSSNNWKLLIGHRTDNTTMLYVVCANESCNKQRRKELGIEDDAFVAWGEFNITGQGMDAINLKKAEGMPN